MSGKGDDGDSQPTLFPTLDFPTLLPVIQLIQLALRIRGFHICRFNQPQIENIKKTNSRKSLKTKLKFASVWQLFT